MLKILLGIVSLVLIALCLLQAGRDGSLISALTGQSTNLFSKRKEKGIDLFVSRATAISLVLFFVLALLVTHGY